jgi:hypothetical protein
MQNALIDAGDRNSGKPKNKLAGYQHKVIMTRSHDTDTDATKDRLQRVILR